MIFNILYWTFIICSSGAGSFLFRTFLYFRGISHMYESYIFNPRTKKKYEELIQTVHGMYEVLFFAELLISFLLPFTEIFKWIKTFIDFELFDPYRKNIK